MLVLSPLDPQSKDVVGVKTWLSCSSSAFSELLYCLSRYKDNPFSLGESFGSRWDTDATWGVDRMEEKEPEVTISSIRPISERVTNRREVENRSLGLESSEARQKFAGAKAISSDMFFGREVDTEVSRVVHPEAGGNG